MGRRKNRKAFFKANLSKISKRMSSPLSSDLKKKYAVNAMPIRVDDEVRILRGWFRHREGKVISVNRKKSVITVERVSIEKINGQTTKVGIDPSKCVITRLKLDSRRNFMLERKQFKKKQKSEETDLDRCLLKTKVKYRFEV